MFEDRYERLFWFLYGKMKLSFEKNFASGKCKREMSNCKCDQIYLFVERVVFGIWKHVRMVSFYGELSVTRASLFSQRQVCLYGSSDAEFVGVLGK